MADPLSSSKYSVAHGRRHVETLKNELDQFFDTKPFKQTIGFDPDGLLDIHKIKLVKELPESLSGIAFDAVSSLRASLDQAGYGVAMAAGESGKKAYFPKLKGSEPFTKSNLVSIGMRKGI